MTDDRELAGLDPYDAFDAEVAHAVSFFSGLAEDQWERPTRCAGWSVRDVLAHLLSGEGYNHATLDGTVQAFLARLGERGATDLAAANELGIRDLDGVPPDALLARWRDDNARTRAGLRARDGRDIDTSVGPYPARWQAFHLAFEVAVHADDVGAPVPDDVAAARRAWQPPFARFMLREYKPQVTTEPLAGASRVRGDGIDVVVPDDRFVLAVASRLPDDDDIDATARALIAATP